eukprot:Skav208018  [mRNA]  locus=scaffold320:294626:295129:- [translate_table: standard]
MFYFWIAPRRVFTVPSKRKPACAAFDWSISPPDRPGVCSQPTPPFSQLKRKISELYCVERTKTADGRVEAGQWLQLVSAALLAILPAVKWSHAFRRVGALNLQKDVSASLLKDFGWTALPDIPPGPPTELQARALFPKGRSKLDVMSYVIWKQPAKFRNGEPIRTLD